MMQPIHHRLSDVVSGIHTLREATAEGDRYALVPVLQTTLSPLCTPGVATATCVDPFPAYGCAYVPPLWPGSLGPH